MEVEGTMYKGGPPWGQNQNLIMKLPKLPGQVGIYHSAYSQGFRITLDKRLLCVFHSFFFPNVSIYCGCPLSIGSQRRQISCPFDHGLLYTLSCYTRSHHIWTWWRELHITQRSRENDCIFFLSEKMNVFLKYRNVLVFYCCITNYHNLSGLTQHTVITWQFLWVENLSKA